MIPVFASTTTVLAAEFVECFPLKKLSTALSILKSDTGITYKKTKNSFTVTGNWQELVKVCENLQNLFEIQKKVHDSEQQSKNNSASDNRNKSEKPVSAAKDVRDTAVYGSGSSKDDQRSRQNITERSFEHMSVGQNESVFIKSEHMSDDDNSLDDCSFGNECNVSESESRMIQTCTPVEGNTEVMQTAGDDIYNNTNCQEKFKMGQTTAEANDEENRIENSTEFTNVKNHRLVRSAARKESYFQADVDSHDESERHEFPCNHCDHHFTAKHLLAAHTMISHSQQPDTSVPKIKTENSETEVRKRGPGRPKKERNDEERRFICETEVRKRGRPKKEINDEEGRFSCTQCNYIGRKEANLNEHVKRQHKATKQACKVCGKLFGYNKDMRRHVETVHGEPKYYCEICDKRYKSQLGYEQHYRTHAEDYVKPVRPIIYCEYCGTSFCSKQSASMHITAVHMGIKEYLCQICGKGFSQKNTYRMHTNAHAGIKPYSCNTCGKSFSYTKSLKDHEHIHDSIGTFKCTVCSKAFKQSASLALHMSIHKEKKDHVCDCCGKGFTQKQALLRHERIHTGDMPFVCSLCSRKFSDESTIRRHMMLVHKKDAKTWKADITKNIKPRRKLLQNKGEDAVNKEATEHGSYRYTPNKKGEDVVRENVNKEATEQASYRYTPNNNGEDAVRGHENKEATEQASYRYTPNNNGEDAVRGHVNKEATEQASYRYVPNNNGEDVVREHFNKEATEQASYIPDKDKKPVHQQSNIEVAALKVREPSRESPESTNVRQLSEPDHLIRTLFQDSYFTGKPYMY